MTDDFKTSGSGSPEEKGDRPESETGGGRAPGRAFGPRPDFAAAATVLSHNFRAPIVAEPAAQVAESEAMTAADAAPAPESETGDEAPPAETGPPATSEEPVVPETDAGAEGLEDVRPRQQGEAEPERAVEAVPLSGSTEESTDRAAGAEPDDATDLASERSDDASPGSDGEFAPDTTTMSIREAATQSVEDRVPEIVDDGLREFSHHEPEGGDSGRDMDADSADPEAMAGSLLAVAVRNGPEDVPGDGQAVDRDPVAETGKREFRFDGTDEPVGPPDAGETEQDAADPKEPEPDDVPLPPDEAELARVLGINFRDGDGTSAGPDLQRPPEEADIARKLGIQFRDDDVATVAGVEGDELSDEARRLGINFRDPTEVRPNRKKVSMTGRLIMLLTLFSGLAGLVMLLFFGESLFEAIFG